MSTDTSLISLSNDKSNTISIDAMGGDRGVSAVVDGVSIAAKKNPRSRFLLHGNAAELTPLLAKRKHLTQCCEVRHTDKSVGMDDKPSHVMRHGKGTSMWSTVEAVRKGEAAAAVSCGNTGALMAVSMIRLRKALGVNRPAIAILWPAINASGFNVMLDVGADIRADEHDLFKYALMGASYARNGLGISTPKIGLLNVGTEEHKGRAELHEAHEMIGDAAENNGYEFVGFVEGGDIPSDRVDVIVTDGFTGNVALKTAEGTASLVSQRLREAFNHSVFSKIGGLFAYTSMRRLQARIDPRRVNGGVFLGLNGTVVKSHGAADATGVAAAVQLAIRLAEMGFTEKLAARVASGSLNSQDEFGETSENPQDK